jgi:hypothetical protein
MVMTHWYPNVCDSNKAFVNLSLSAVTGQPGSESECNLVDSLLYDIRSGFQQSKGLNGSSRDLRVSTANSHFSSLLEQDERIYKLWKYKASK